MPYIDDETYEAMASKIVQQEQALEEINDIAMECWHNGGKMNATGWNMLARSKFENIVTIASDAILGVKENI